MHRARLIATGEEVAVKKMNLDRVSMSLVRVDAECSCRPLMHEVLIAVCWAAAGGDRS